MIHPAIDRNAHARGNVTGGRRAAFEHLKDRRLMAVGFDWAFTLGAAGSDSVRDVTVDPAGNVGIVGTFSGTVDFDPGPGVSNLTSTPADSRNNYVAKYDAGGNLLSAQPFGGEAAPWNKRPIVFDASGNMVIAGTFTGAVEFGSTTLTSQGLDDVFVAKFDSSGNVLWARRFGDIQAESVGGLALDSAGNVLVGASNLNSDALADALILRLDTSGNELWTWRVGASTSGRRPNSSNAAGVSSITVDSAGNVYASGRVTGTVDFDPSAAVTTLSSSSPGAFVVKLAPTGSLSWARVFEAKTSRFGYAGSAGIGIGSDGKVYSTGVYRDSVDFDPGPLNTQKYVMSSSTPAGYVSALTPGGNFLWAKSTRSVTNGQMVVDDLVLDATNNIYISGDFTGEVDFDPGAGAATLNANSSFITFVWKLNANGGYEWAGAMGTQGDHYGYAIDVDASGNIYTAGRWSGSGDFDPGTGTYNLTSSRYVGYLVKLTQTSTLAGSASTSLSTNSLLATESTAKRRRATLDSVFASLSLDQNDWGRRPL
jgi:hypothetical protein